MSLLLLLYFISIGLLLAYCHLFTIKLELYTYTILQLATYTKGMYFSGEIFGPVGGGPKLLRGVHLFQ